MLGSRVVQDMAGWYFRANIEILVIAVNFLLIIFLLSISGSDLVNEYTVSVKSIPNQITFHSNEMIFLNVLLKSASLFVWTTQHVIL